MNQEINQFQITCPKCSEKKLWKTSDGRLKCKNCRYVFTPKPNPLNIPNEVLNEVISEFLLEHSTNIILERINISKYKLLKVLTLLRILMSIDVPDPLFGMIKLDKEYLNHQIKKLRKKESPENSQSNFAIKQPIMGIISKEEKVYAKVLRDLDVKDLKNFIKNQKKNINEQSENWQKNIGLIFKNRLYKIGKEKPVIDTLDGFWGYLKRKLSAKGGIQKEKLPLYLGEYAWRYNHRKLTVKEQEELLLNLVLQYFEFARKLL